MVESLVESAPELAIKKLDSLGLTGHLGLSYRARYAVLYAMALDKQSVDDGTFLPEIRKYEDYFERHGTEETAFFFIFIMATSCRIPLNMKSLQFSSCVR